MWELLSKISDDIGAVLTDDIVNYTRNVVDINTCKVPELIEHGRSISYGLDHLKNAYDFFPLRIQCLIDIFSINPEYLIGNAKNHILSDEVIKEILSYVRDHSGDRTPFTNSDVIDRLIDDPHGLMDETTYRNFIVELFFTTIVQALKAKYSSGNHPDEDQQPIAFNMLHRERENQSNIVTRLNEYRSWVDKFISNEVDHPWNSSGMDKYGQEDDNAKVSNSTDMPRVVEVNKARKKISPKFNPFKIADHIFFNGLNPTHQLSQDELDLVEMVMEYHSKTKYDYAA